MRVARIASWSMAGLLLFGVVLAEWKRRHKESTTTAP
jgi:hypothetical protein